jgi:hydroxysqualene dehydroxylase
MTADRLKVAVVGGGWAGCAAAVELSRRDYGVTLFEAARTLGGRARCVEVEGKKLDNGQHILLGAYTETLQLMRTVGINPDDALLRLPLQMRYPMACGGMDFVTPRLPAPFHMLLGLLRAKGLEKEDKLSLARFTTTARWMDWQLDRDCSVAELLDRFDQTSRLIKLMWQPLCVAALNTPPERASAQVFLNVLRDSLGARRSASDMLIPRMDLSSLFPQQAAQFILRHGGRIECGTVVRGIQQYGSQWRMNINSSDASPFRFADFDSVIVATQPAQAAALLDGVIDTARLNSFGYEPITTCYLQYEPAVKLEQPFLALVDDPNAGDWGQFVFDRGQLDANHPGLLAVVVSASGNAIAPGHEALLSSITAQLVKSFCLPELSAPIWTKIISEKRATFSCTPALVRPKNATTAHGLALAGDYTDCDYPATLESAIRSGLQAARHIDA